MAETVPGVGVRDPATMLAGLVEVTSSSHRHVQPQGSSPSEGLLRVMVGEILCL